MSAAAPAAASPAPAAASPSALACNSALETVPSAIRAGTAQILEQGISDDGHGVELSMPQLSGGMAASQAEAARTGSPVCARSSAGRSDRCQPCLRMPPPFHNRPKELRKRGGDGRPHQPLSRRLCALAAQPGGVLGRGRRRHRLVREAEEDLRQERRHLRPLVRRRHLQHLLQRARPPRRRRPRRPAGADLRFPRHQHDEDLHLRPHAVRGAAARRHAARLRRREGRPRHPLYADGAGGGVRHARLRAHRRHPFGGVRRLCGEGARHPHRRLPSRR